MFHTRKRGFPGLSLEHGTTGVNSMSHTRRGFPGLSLVHGTTGVK